MVFMMKHVFQNIGIKKLLSRLEQSEQFGQITIRKPEPISRDSILLAHDATYVDAFLEEKLRKKKCEELDLFLGLQR